MRTNKTSLFERLTSNILNKEVIGFTIFKLLIWIGLAVAIGFMIKIPCISIHIIDIISVELILAAMMLGWFLTGLIYSIDKKIPLQNDSEISKESYKGLCDECCVWGRAHMSWMIIHYASVLFPIFFSFAALYIVTQAFDKEKIIIYTFLSLVGSVVSILLNAEKRSLTFNKKYDIFRHALYSFNLGEIDDNELIDVFFTEPTEPDFARRL